ncbi:MAG: hypothetical protein B7Y31_04845, partial [Novosphingobium sp. 16-62-11]
MVASSPSENERHAVRAAAIVVAAGKGLRTGGAVPKQFVVWRGKPLVRHSVEALLRAGLLPVVVAIPEDWRDVAEQALAGLVGVRLVAGGATRQESVLAALEALVDDAPAKVLIHDAARPGLPRAVIDRLLAALDDGVAAIPALPVVDSVVRGEAGTMLHPESRDELYRVQTPQAFDYGKILAAHRAWSGQRDAGDDAHHLGLAIAGDEGRHRNHEQAGNIQLLAIGAGVLGGEHQLSLAAGRTGGVLHRPAHENLQRAGEVDKLGGRGEARLEEGFELQLLAVHGGRKFRRVLLQEGGEVWLLHGFAVARNPRLELVGQRKAVFHLVVAPAGFVRGGVIIDDGRELRRRPRGGREDGAVLILVAVHEVHERIEGRCPRRALAHQLRAGLLHQVDDRDRHLRVPVPQHGHARRQAGLKAFRGDHHHFGLGGVCAELRKRVDGVAVERAAIGRAGA